MPHKRSLQLHQLNICCATRAVLLDHKTHKTHLNASLYPFMLHIDCICVTKCATKIAASITKWSGDMSLLPDGCFSVFFLADRNTFIILYYV
jgi:hypothetical protein